LTILGFAGRRAGIYLLEQFRFHSIGEKNRCARRALCSPATDTFGGLPMNDTVTAPEPSAAQLLDVRAVAALLGCSPRHVYRLADAAHMPPPRRLGALVRWSRQELMDWIASGCKSCRTAGRG
jgi:excisionase family DNA binding protein